LRKRRLKSVSLDDLPDLPEEEPDSGEVRKIPPAVLMKMISDLPEGYRTVFNLFCMEGWSHRDIGLKLGIGEKSSSSQYSRARALLAKKIKEYLNGQEG
jgi:RNA polymerase sigma-70 factor (ECF subfamily)